MWMTRNNNKQKFDSHLTLHYHTSHYKIMYLKTTTTTMNNSILLGRDNCCSCNRRRRRNVRSSSNNCSSSSCSIRTIMIQQQQQSSQKQYCCCCCRRSRIPHLHNNVKRDDRNIPDNTFPPNLRLAVVSGIPKLVLLLRLLMGVIIIVVVLVSSTTTTTTRTTAMVLSRDIKHSSFIIDSSSSIIMQQQQQRPIVAVRRMIPTVHSFPIQRPTNKRNHINCSRYLPPFIRTKTTSLSITTTTTTTAANNDKELDNNSSNKNNDSIKNGNHHDRINEKVTIPTLKNTTTKAPKRTPNTIAVSSKYTTPKTTTTTTTKYIKENHDDDEIGDVADTILKTTTTTMQTNYNSVLLVEQKKNNPNGNRHSGNTTTTNSNNDVDVRYQIQSILEQISKVSTATTAAPETIDDVPTNADNTIYSSTSHYSSDQNTTTSSSTMGMTTIKLTQSYCDYLFAECIAQNEWDLAYTAVRDGIMKYATSSITSATNHSPIQIQYSTYSACIQACFQYMNAANALQILQIMMDNDDETDAPQQQPQINDYTMVLLTMCRAYLAGTTTGVAAAVASFPQQRRKLKSDTYNLNDNNPNNASTNGTNHPVDWCTQAVQLFETVQRKTKIDVPITVYDAILTCYKQKKDWKQSIHLLQSMINNHTDSGIVAATKPVLSTYRIVIECCINAKQPDAAFRILQLFIQNHIHRNKNTNDPTDADKNEQQQQQQQLSSSSSLPPTSYLFELVICALTSVKGDMKKTNNNHNNNNNHRLLWRRSLQLLDTMIEMNVPRTLQIYNSIFIVCSKLHEPNVAKNVYLKMKQYDMNTTITKRSISNGVATIIRPNIVTYNSILSAYISSTSTSSNNNNNNYYWRDALQIFDQIQREPGVTPDICTYTNAIRACVKGGKTERAKSLIQVVKDKGLPLDSYFYSAALTASDWSNAIKLLQEMEQNGIPPTEFSYSITIKACGISGQWEKALELLDVMRTTKNMSVNLYVYNAAITAVAKAAKQRMKNLNNNAFILHGKTDTNESTLDGPGQNQVLSTEVRSLFNKMRADGIEPDGFSYSSAISCYGSEGQWEEALSTLKEMRNGGPNVQPNKVAYTAAISSCARAGKVDLAEQLFCQMQEQGHQPDTVAYNTLFLAYREGNRSDAVLDLWNEMIQKSKSALHRTSPRTGYIPSSTLVRPDIITVTEAIEALTTNDSHFEINRLHIDKILSDAVNYGILLRQELSSSSVNQRKDQLVDLTYMTFAVARAACRYVLFDLISMHEADIHDLYFVTGSGVQHGNMSAPQQQRSELLRDYIKELLYTDYYPTLASSIVTNKTITAARNQIVPHQHKQHQRLCGVVIKAETLKTWILVQQQSQQSL